MLTITLFQKEDLPMLAKWGHHQDTRLTHYDFKGFKDSDYHRWFRRKQRLFTKRLYAVKEDGILQGFITLKNIKWVKKEAFMGIVFNPDVVGRGLGTQALRQFLTLYFDELDMHVLRLKVADFNQRALKSYLACGFEVIQTQEEPFEDQSRNFALVLADSAFRMNNQQLVTCIHEMQVTKDTRVK